MPIDDFDFSGYATKANLRCSDGRIIRPDAFKDNDGQTVPLVWQHMRDNPTNVLGHAYLENRNDGVYAYCKFNNTDEATHAKELVRHGDINAMSIYANHLTQRGGDVIHGSIREVSLVMAGANPGATIDHIEIQHSDGSVVPIDDEAIIYSGEQLDEIEHADGSYRDRRYMMHADEEDDGGDDETVQDVFDTLSEKQKTVVYYLIGQAIDQNKSGGGASEADEGDEDVAHGDYDDGGYYGMKYNVFEGGDSMDDGSYTMTHDDFEAVVADAKRCGSMKQALEHFADDLSLEHGISDIELLFPEAHPATAQPELISRPMEWVPKVWNAAKKSPFSRIKTMYADITMDEARAKGYIKGHRKVEEQFSVLKRTTQPTTIYKKQKMDRDDIIDITDFNVVNFIKSEMRTMWNEEASRAILIGDGREVHDEDKVDESCIRPIYSDNPMYTIRQDVVFDPDADVTDKSNAIVDAAILGRKNYRGSGALTFFTTTDVLNTLMLARDKIGNRLYKSQGELASAMRVREIVEVQPMEGLSRHTEAGDVDCLGILVDMNDYTIGADRGGQMETFDDFDIDYNQYKYLMEGRFSGALNKPYSAIVLEQKTEKQPIKLVITPTDSKQERYGVKAGALQNDIAMGSDFICGKLYHQAEYTGFSLNADQREGYFLALDVNKGDADKVTVKVINGNDKEPKEVTDDYVVVKIFKPESQKIQFVATKSGSPTVTKTYNVRNLFMI